MIKKIIVLSTLCIMSVSCKTPQEESRVMGTSNEDALTYGFLSKYQDALNSKVGSVYRFEKSNIPLSKTWNCTWNDTRNNQFNNTSFSVKLVSLSATEAEFQSTNNDPNIGIAGKYEFGNNGGLLAQKTNRANASVMKGALWQRNMKLPTSAARKGTLIGVSIAHIDTKKWEENEKYYQYLFNNRTQALLAFVECLPDGELPAAGSSPANDCHPTATAEPLDCGDSGFASSDGCPSDAESGGHFGYAKCVSGPKACFDKTLTVGSCGSPNHGNCPGSQNNVRCD